MNKVSPPTLLMHQDIYYFLLSCHGPYMYDEFNIDNNNNTEEQHTVREMVRLIINKT